MSKEEQLANMPKEADQVVEDDIKHWLFSLDMNELKELADFYKLDSNPLIERYKYLLNQINLGKSPTQASNEFWIYGVNNEHP